MIFFQFLLNFDPAKKCGKYDARFTFTEESDHSGENTCENEVLSFALQFLNHFSLTLNRKKRVVMRVMRKKVNMFTLQLQIHYILE